jgi:hypothetical protein
MDGDVGCGVGALGSENYEQPEYKKNTTALLQDNALRQTKLPKPHTTENLNLFRLRQSTSPSQLCAQHPEYN